MQLRDEPTALTGPVLVADTADERRGLAVTWCGVGLLLLTGALLAAEAAAIPFQVDASVTAADSLGNFWPLLGTLALGVLGAALVLGGRQAWRTARRRREWLPTLRR